MSQWTGRRLAATNPVCLALALSGCVLTREIALTTEPSGARIWLGNQYAGHSPLAVDAKATGPIERYTFQPQYVTIELDGYEREIVALDYEWSRRNVILSIPFILGVPGILLWGKLPEDLHVPLEPTTPTN